MADVNETFLALTVYNNLCSALDKRKWHYEKDDQEFVISFSVAGDYMASKYIFVVDIERQLVRVLSPLLSM